MHKKLTSNIEGPLLTLFLRLQKNNRLSRKPCKRRSDLVLIKWTNESTKINRAVYIIVLLENRVSGGLPLSIMYIPICTIYIRQPPKSDQRNLQAGITLYL